MSPTRISVYNNFVVLRTRIFFVTMVVFQNLLWVQCFTYSIESFVTKYLLLLLCLVFLSDFFYPHLYKLLTPPKILFSSVLIVYPNAFTGKDHYLFLTYNILKLNLVISMQVMKAFLPGINTCHLLVKRSWKDFQSSLFLCFLIY